MMYIVTQAGLGFALQALIEHIFVRYQLRALIARKIQQIAQWIEDQLEQYRQRRIERKLEIAEEKVRRAHELYAVECYLNLKQRFNEKEIAILMAVLQ